METNSEMPVDWIVLINPMAGDHKGRDDWEEISHWLDRCKMAYQPHFTEYARHSIPLIHDFLGRGYRKFIIAGGDGFLHEAVNAVFTQTAVGPERVTLAMIPVGTGNDWAKTFNIPTGYEASIEIIKKGKTLRHDIGRVFFHVMKAEKSEYFINMCGLGLDAEVTRKANTARDKGSFGAMKYQYSILSTLMGYAPTRMTLVIDGRRIEHEVVSMALGIAQYNGGGAKQLPFAVPDDGLFDLSIIKTTSKLKLMRSVKKMYDGSFVQLPEVSTYTGKSIEIESDPQCLMEADGEVLGESPLRFEIIPQALNVVIP